MSDDEENGFRGHENMKVPLPEAYDSIKIPELFIIKAYYKTGNFERNPNGKFKRDSKGEKIPIRKEGWFIDTDLMENEVLNKTRNISSRHKRKLLDLETAKVGKITANRNYIPRLKDFPNINHRRYIYNYLTHLNPDEIKDLPHNKTRGLPPILPKNWKRKGFGDFPKGYEGKEGKKDSDTESESDREVSHQDIFGSDSESDDAPSPKASKQRATPSESPKKKSPKKKSPPKKAKKAIPISQLESDSESDEEEEEQSAGGGAGGGKARGRPRKHLTEKEAYLAKIKSNKDKRAERAKEARRLKIKDKLAKGEKLTKKERELHEAEGEGIKEGIKDPCWEGYEMKGMKMKKNKKVPNCIPKGEGIDFENIKWGTFKALYNRFMKNNPTFKDKIEDLEHFAHFVVANPNKFSKVAHKKALFYQNILEHKTEGGKLSKIGQAFNKAFNPQKNGVAKNKFIKTMVKNATSKDDNVGELPPNDN